MYLRTVISNNTNYHLLNVCCHPDTILSALYATFTSCNKPLKQVLFFPCNRINIADVMCSRSLSLRIEQPGF